MKKQKIIIASDFGNYLAKRRPKGIANEFLYYEPSLILWADKIICDKYALEAEKLYAKEGSLVSELFILLENKRIVESENFELFLHDNIKNKLVEASEEDLQSIKKENLEPPVSTIDPENIPSRQNAFYDINSMIYLSYVLDYPYLDVKETNYYYEWKLRNIINIGYHFNKAIKEREILAHMLDIYVPSFELFPKNQEFFEAQDYTTKLCKLFREFCDKKINLNTYKREYSVFLEKWDKYEHIVRSQVLENFENLLDLRKDFKLKALRRFLSEFSLKIMKQPGDKEYYQEVALRLKREILEIEIELAEKFTFFNFLDKCESYISFPIQISSILAGVTASWLTQNPFFAALSVAPTGVKWLAKTLEEKKRRKLAWYFYLLDFKKKVNRENEIFLIEQEIRKIEKN